MTNCVPFAWCLPPCDQSVRSRVFSVALVPSSLQHPSPAIPLVRVEVLTRGGASSIGIKHKTLSIPLHGLAWMIA